MDPGRPRGSGARGILARGPGRKRSYSPLGEIVWLASRLRRGPPGMVTNNLVCTNSAALGSKPAQQLANGCGLYAPADPKLCRYALQPAASVEAFIVLVHAHVRFFRSAYRVTWSVSTKGGFHPERVIAYSGKSF